MYAQKIKGVWVELPSGAPVKYQKEGSEFQASYDSVLLWSEKERDSAGIYQIREGEATPEGSYLVSRELIDRDLRPAWKNTFAPIPEQSSPQEVTMRQAKIALSRAARLTQANAAIEAMSGQQGEEARIEWQYATVLRRDHPLVLGIGQALGMDDATIDTLFKEAAKV